jgi:plastocyanin
MEDIMNSLRLNVALGATALIFGMIGTRTNAFAASVPTVAGCSSSDFVDGLPANQITTAGTAFTPKCLRVKAGASVTIEASDHHPLKAMPDLGSDKNPFADASTFTTPQTRVFNSPGVFGYFCTRHGDDEGDGMAGAIVVVP